MRIRAKTVARAYTRKVLELCRSEKGSDASRTFAEIRCQVDALLEAVPALRSVTLQTGRCSHGDAVSLRIYEHPYVNRLWRGETLQDVTRYVTEEIAAYLEA